MFCHKFLLDATDCREHHALLGSGIEFIKTKRKRFRDLKSNLLA